MIPARKSRLFNAWFAGHARSKIQRGFSGVFLRGVDHARRAAEEGPLLIVSNHTSWWDPLVVLHLSQHVLCVDGHALMDAKNLRRLPFFSLVGAFGVDLDRPADGAAAIKYAARLLDRPKRMLWVFPQGRERPVNERPLDFRAGSAEIARLAKKATALPAALRYELGAEEKPRLYVSFGEAIAKERDVDRARKEQERAVVEELDRIDRAVRGEAGADAFAQAHRGEQPLLGALAERALAWLTRPREPATPPSLAGRRPDRR